VTSETPAEALNRGPEKAEGKEQLAVLTVRDQRLRSRKMGRRNDVGVSLATVSPDYKVKNKKTGVGKRERSTPSL